MTVANNVLYFKPTKEKQRAFQYGNKLGVYNTIHCFLDFNFQYDLIFFNINTCHAN